MERGLPASCGRERLRLAAPRSRGRFFSLALGRFVTVSFAGDRCMVAIGRGKVAVSGVSVPPVAVGVVSIEHRSHSSVRVVMISTFPIVKSGFAVSIVETSLAEGTLNLLAQSLGNEGRVTFTASDAAYVGRVDVKLHGDAFVDAAKNGERLKRGRDIIGLVTIHDFLVKRSDPASTVTT